MNLLMIQMHLGNKDYLWDFKEFKLLFNNDPDKYKSLAIAYSSCSSLNEQYDQSSFSFISLRKF